MGNLILFWAENKCSNTQFVENISQTLKGKSKTATMSQVQDQYLSSEFEETCQLAPSDGVRFVCDLFVFIF